MAMKFVAEYPVLSDADGGAWLRPDNIVRFAQTLETSGLDAIAFTDHPAPSKKWLANGGHESFDPFVALGFCAAVTRRLRLMTHLAVAPYRNPLLQARSVASLDVLSGGRTILVLGAGYLRSEFAALGVEFDERLALFEESADVLKQVWTSDEFSYRGKHFTAHGVSMKPLPVQRPHPPLWLGGNSTTVLDRVARWGKGWSVMLGPPALAGAVRTKTISSESDLASSLDDLQHRLAENGRSLSDIDVQVHSEAGDLNLDTRAVDRIHKLEALAAMGVTWAGVRAPHQSFEDALERLARFGETVACRLR
jgi:probable F420-dependent oxidoreductase